MRSTMSARVAKVERAARTALPTSSLRRAASSICLLPRLVAAKIALCEPLDRSGEESYGGGDAPRESDRGEDGDEKGSPKTQARSPTRARAVALSSALGIVTPMCHTGTPGTTWENMVIAVPSGFL